MDNKLTIYYQNCRGLRTKLNTLYNNILAECFDIIVLTETWLIPNIADCELVDSRYLVYRCDRDREACGKSDGGGVLVAVRRGLNAIRCVIRPSSLSDSGVCCNLPSNIDYVFLKFETSVHHEYSVVCGVYIPPNQNDNTYELLFNAFQYELTSGAVNDFFIIGDFNLPHVEWDSNDKYAIMRDQLQSSSSTYRLLSHFLSLLNAKQYNIFKNSKDRILDLFISNTDTCKCELPLSPLVQIDNYHPPFIAHTIFLEVPQKPMIRCAEPKYKFIEANYDVINSEIHSIDWANILNGLSLESAVYLFYEEINKIIRKHVPLRPTKSKEFPIWFSRPLIHVFKNKEKAWIRWKKYGNKSDYETFAVFRRRFKLLCKECYNTYINSIESGMHRDLKLFWSFVKTRKDKNGIPSNMTYNNSQSNNPQEICNMFSKYFGSVYVKKDTASTLVDLDSLPCTSTNGIILSDISFSIDTIIRTLKTLDVAKGSGPDGLPPLFFKHTADSISIPLFHIFNRSLREGYVPRVWKAANITPVFKCGSKNIVSNYRPISLLSTLSKVLERLVHNNVYSSFHNIIIPEQHGFVKNRSTVSNLVLYANFLFDKMDKRLQIDSIYTDFCKAFDKVDHEILLQKIAYNGIRGNLLRWFSSYVTNRTQKVVINGFSSDEISVSSGVPQGSIMGPLLFLIFINDISTCFKNSNFLLYADDLKIFRSIKTFDDCVLLQDDLDRLTSYCQENKLILSLPKCKSITFTKKSNIIQFEYSLCNTPLEKVSLIKDLGVFFDSKLHFDYHINHIINKAFQLYGFVMRTCKPFKKSGTYLLLYKSLIRPQLEYATQVWNPFYQRYRDLLESVQSKYLRSVNYRCYRSWSSYVNLLHKYSLSTLSKRRSLLDCVFLYKVCRNFFDCSEFVNCIYFRVPSRSQRIRNTHAHRLFSLDLCKTNAGKRAPLRRIMELYDSSFSDVDLFTMTLPQFKKAIILALNDL